MGSDSSGPAPQTIIVQQPTRGRWITRLLLVLLVLSVMLNLVLLASIGSYLTDTSGPTEKYRSGNVASPEKIALLEVDGTIMPPFTERTLKTIKAIEEDDAVKGVVLTIDSPGGLVADSHQIYHHLRELSRKKPIYVAMSRIAASGGYYIAMGAGPEGRIFVEPTTWTGSIGVIMPRYDLSELGTKIGVDSQPLSKGSMKDALNPFRELTDAERDVWDSILEESYQRFQQVIVDNRPNLDAADVKELATGQVYTADQALENGLVDEIAFQEEVIDLLADKLGLTDPRVVTYQHPLTLPEILLGSMGARASQSPWQTVLEAGVPRAMYFCGWNAALSYPHSSEW